MLEQCPVQRECSKYWQVLLLIWQQFTNYVPITKVRAVIDRHKLLPLTGGRHHRGNHVSSNVEYS